MKCPKCQAAMEKLTVESIEVDRCTQCQGIWFDNGELEAVAQIKNAAAIDTGARHIGKELDKAIAVNCPRCDNVVMYRDPVDGHEHIRVEHCPSCHGRFLDAGELTHVASNNVLEKMQALIARMRK